MGRNWVKNSRSYSEFLSVVLRKGPESCQRPGNSWRYFEFPSAEDYTATGSRNIQFPVVFRISRGAPICAGGEKLLGIQKIREIREFSLLFEFSAAQYLPGLTQNGSKLVKKWPI